MKEAGSSSEVLPSLPQQSSQQDIPSDHDYFCQQSIYKISEVISLHSDEDLPEDLQPNGVSEDISTSEIPLIQLDEDSLEEEESCPPPPQLSPPHQNGYTSLDEQVLCNGMSSSTPPAKETPGVDSEETQSALSGSEVETDEASRTSTGLKNPPTLTLEEPSKTEVDQPQPLLSPTSAPSTPPTPAEPIASSSKQAATSPPTPATFPKSISLLEHHLTQEPTLQLHQSPSSPLPHLADTKSFLNFLTEENMPREVGLRKVRVLPTLEEMINTMLKLGKLQGNEPTPVMVAESAKQQPKVNCVGKVEQELVTRAVKEFPAKVEEHYNPGKYIGLDPSSLQTLRLVPDQALIEAPSLVCPYLKMEEKQFGNMLKKGMTPNTQTTALKHEVLLRDVGHNEVQWWLHREQVVHRRRRARRRNAGGSVISFQAADNEESEDKVKKAIEKQVTILYTGHIYFCKFCSFAKADPSTILEHVESAHFLQAKTLVPLHSLTCPLCHRKFASLNPLKIHLISCSNVDKEALRPTLELGPGVTMRPATYVMQRDLFSGKMQFKWETRRKTPASKQPPTVIHTAEVPPNLHPRVPVQPYLSSLPQIRPRPSPIQKIPLHQRTIPLPRKRTITQIQHPANPLLHNIGPQMKLRKLNSDMAECHFICELCDAHINCLEDYSLHLERKHKVFLPEHRLNEPHFKCNHCSQVSCTPEGYQRHFVYRHSICYTPHNEKDSGTCGICFKVIRTNLRKHLCEAHQFKLQESELIFKCKTCGDLFRQFRAYEDHYTVAHAT